MSIKISGFDEITPELVQKACVESGIGVIPHHDCSVCGAWVSYRVMEGNLWFSPACDCGYSPLERRDWRSLSDWIHMQNDEWKQKIAATCGIEIVGSDQLTQEWCNE